MVSTPVLPPPTHLLHLLPPSSSCDILSVPFFSRFSLSMVEQFALRSSLVCLAVVIVIVGLCTNSFKKMLWTYLIGLLGIAGILVPDWCFFDRDFSRWLSPVSAAERASHESVQRRELKRFRIYPMRLAIYTTVYGFVLYKWWTKLMAE